MGNNALEEYKLVQYNTQEKASKNPRYSSRSLTSISPRINTFTIENYDQALNKEQLIEEVSEILNHPNGWRRFYQNRYEYSDKDHDVKIIFKEKPLFWNNLSFQMFDRIYINTNNWKNRGEDYKYYVINHELGHYYRKGHFHSCINGKAPIMMQQTLGIGKCHTNVFPLKEDFENDVLFNSEEWFIIVLPIIIMSLTMLSRKTYSIFRK